MRKAQTVAETQELPTLQIKIPYSQTLGENYLRQKAIVEVEKDKLDYAEERVLMQMKSEGRSVMAITLEGERFRFEISAVGEKLKVGKAK